MNYNELINKLERVIKELGVKATFIEHKIGIARNTLAYYRDGRLKLREDKYGKLKEILDMYNI